MTGRDYNIVIDEMLEATAFVEYLIQGETAATLAANRERRTSIERHIEIISEAVCHLPEMLTNRFPEIEWRKIRAIGNVLRHRYHATDPQIVWHVASQDLPKLAMVLATMKES